MRKLIALAVTLSAAAVALPSQAADLTVAEPPAAVVEVAPPPVVVVPTETVVGACWRYGGAGWGWYTCDYGVRPVYGYRHIYDSHGWGWGRVWR